MGINGTCDKSWSMKQIHKHDTHYYSYIRQHNELLSRKISQKKQKHSILQEIYSGITYINPFGEKYIYPDEIKSKKPEKSIQYV